MLVAKRRQPGADRVQILRGQQLLRMKHLSVRKRGRTSYRTSRSSSA